MAFLIDNKKILVTGAGRGIGRALTISLVKAGAVVYALSKNQSNLDSVVKECGGKNIHPIQVDLADWANTRKAIESLEPMDGLVNNAGISLGWVASLDAPKAMIDKTLSVNVMAAVNTTQVIGKKMVDAGRGGSIINVSSINGLNPMRECLAYNMSKAALDMLTKQFALELGPHNIRVNSINQTVVITDMTRESYNDPVRAAKMKGLTPLGRYAEADEIVGPIMYLLSDYSSMVSGTMHVIDGGLLSNTSV